MSTLLLDLGNTRLKVAMLDDEYCHLGGIPARSNQAWLSDLDSLLKQNPDCICLASVANSSATQLLIDHCEARWPLKVNKILVGDYLEHLATCYEAGQLGVDRWLAMLGCHTSNGRASLVVDAGTAITLDIVSAEGVHQGGYILPGLRSMRETLSRDTALSVLPVESPPAVGLALDTAMAMELGPLRAVTALINEMIAFCVGQTDVFIGGGDAELVQTMLRHPSIKVDQMVLQGLAHLVQLERKICAG